MKSYSTHSQDVHVVTVCFVTYTVAAGIHQCRKQSASSATYTKNVT